ncbi:glycosyltransferase family 4 protein [Yoonia sp. BS5-3]|uniref:Glycosyltransferase family 4 protein n=1 Tax=Yoonia phaeophyticola TaxID=3137369 RepID=A0ABZ2V5J6_9RHOB
MNKCKAAFAIPGDIETLTGGYIYDRKVLTRLRAQGHDISHIALPGTFPEPPAADMDAAFASLGHLPADRPVIIDGLAFGALDPTRVAAIKAPIVALIHHPLAKENGLAPLRQKQLHETERANLGHAAQVIVPSPHTAAILTEEYNVPLSKISVARPGTDQPHDVEKPAHPPLLLSVGIQLPRKGHDVLLKALAAIQDLDWQAKIVGSALDPAFANALEELRQSLGLADRVVLTGKIDQEALGALYRKATIFALATRYEGYGIVFDEALAHGLPIISCAAGAVIDTVPKGAGVLVPPDDPDAFAAALRRVLTEQTTRHDMAMVARTAGRNLPGWDDTAEVFQAALARITQSQRATTT